jgi:hypothetical protein
LPNNYLKFLTAAKAKKKKLIRFMTLKEKKYTKSITLSVDVTYSGFNQDNEKKTKRL